MDYRIAPASRGMDWFRGGIRVLDRNPRALFAIALLYCVLGAAPRLLQSVPSLAIIAGVLGWLLFPALWAGMLFAVAEAEAGRPVALSHLFEGLRRPGARGPLMLFGVFVLLAVVACGAAAVHFLGQGDPKAFLEVFARLGSGKLDPASAEAQQLAVPIFKTFVVVLVVAALVLSALFFAVPRVFFGRRGSAVGALGQSLAATGANALPLTVLGLVSGAVALVVLLVLGIGAALFGLFGPVGSMLFLPVVLAAYAIVTLVGAGMNYLAWRDVYDDAPQGPSDTRAGIVV